MSGWPMVALGEVVEILGGGTPSKKNPLYWGGEIPWASVKDFKSGALSSTQDFVTEDGIINSASRVVPAGNIIVPTRMAVGKVAVNTIDLAINQDLKALFPKLNINTRYLYHCLQANEETLLRHATGATVQGITLDVLRGLSIPLPPLDEQKRIAAILDKADALRRRRHQALTLLDTLTQSIFVEMFGRGKSPEFSIQALLNNSILLLHKDGNHGGSYPRKDDFGDDGVPFLSAKDVNANGMFQSLGHQLLNESKANSLRHGWIQAGDVLLSHNASIGKVAKYNGEFGRALIGTSLTCFRPNTENLTTEFLYAALRSPLFQAQLAKNMSQTTRNQVPITAQKELTIPVPALDLQLKYCANVAPYAATRGELTSHTVSLNALFASLQFRAFSGEL